MDTKLLGEKIEVVLKNDEVQEETISLKEIINVLIIGKFKILVVMLMCLAMGFVYSVYTKTYLKEVRTIIQFDYAGATSGLDPAGNKLDTSIIKSPAILSDVVDNLNLGEYGIDTEVLRNNISIQPVIPGDIKQKIKDITASKKLATVEDTNKVKDYKYYPNEFQIVFSVPDALIAESKCEEILNEVVKSYNKYFYTKYSSRGLLANVVKDINFSEYDYPEISEVINNQIDLIYNFLSNRKDFKNDDNFRSKTTGMTFQDIMQSVKVVDQVDVNRMDSLINTYSLTKNKVSLIKLYEYRIKRLELAKNKKGDESLITGKMMDKFERKKNVLYSTDMSSLKENSSKDNIDVVNDRESYYSNLADQSLTAGVEAQNNEHDIKYYQDAIERLKNDEVQLNDKKVVEKDVLTISKNISKQLDKWIGITNESISEYYETNFDNTTIKIKAPSETYIKNSKIIILGVALLIGLIIGILLTFVTVYWKRLCDEVQNEKKENVKAKFSPISF